MSARCESVGLRCGIDQIGSEVWCKSIAAEVEVAGVITSPRPAPREPANSGNKPWPGRTLLRFLLAPGCGQLSRGCLLPAVPTAELLTPITPTPGTNYGRVWSPVHHHCNNTLLQVEVNLELALHWPQSLKSLWYDDCLKKIEDCLRRYILIKKYM